MDDPQSSAFEQNANATCNDTFAESRKTPPLTTTYFIATSTGFEAVASLINIPKNRRSTPPTAHDRRMKRCPSKTNPRAKHGWIPTTMMAWTKHAQRSGLASRTFRSRTRAAKCWSKRNQPRCAARIFIFGNGTIGVARTSPPDRHETSGSIVALGEGVSSHAVGDVVAIECLLAGRASLRRRQRPCLKTAQYLASMDTELLPRFRRARYHARHVPGS